MRTRQSGFPALSRVPDSIEAVEATDKRTLRFMGPGAAYVLSGMWRSLVASLRFC